jgi:hypothetical protein
MSASPEYQTGSTTGTVAAILLPGGAGKKEALAGAGKTIVIGEGMDAVRAAGRAYGARWYQFWTKNFPIKSEGELNAALARNERWITSKVKAGYDFITIGLDPLRATRGPFYQRELDVLRRFGITPRPVPRV